MIKFFEADTNISQPEDDNLFKRRKMEIREDMNIVEPEKYMLCEKCSIPFLPTNNSQKYCRSCYYELHKQWQKESMKKQRNNKNM